MKAEERADMAEYNASSLQREVYRLESELEDQQSLVTDIKSGLENTLTDLNEYE